MTNSGQSEPLTIRQRPDLRLKGDILAYVAVALILATTAAGIYDLANSGQFRWHVHQPALIQGGIELLVIGVLLALLQRLRRQWIGVALSAVVVLLYLRLHAIDLAVLVSAFYCLGIYALGSSASRHLIPCHDQRSGMGIGRAAALGLVLMTLVLWLPALIWGLSFETTRVMGFMVAGCGWLLWLCGRPWRTWRIPQCENAISAMTRALVIVCLLALMARSNVVIGYDSMWYGLRPDRVLFGEHGIYNFLGLTTQVHYYPKLYEVALAPLHGWGDLSFDTGFNAWALLLLVIAIAMLARDHGLGARRGWAIAAALACYPAFVATAESSKGDILAAAFVLFCIRALVRAQRSRRSQWLADVAIFALLASAIRLSTLPWLAVLFVASVFVWSRIVLLHPKRSVDWLRFRPGFAVLLAVAAVSLVHYRTWLLTGTPLITNAGGQLLLDRLGFAMRYPIGHLTGAGGAPAGLDAIAYFPRLALQPSAFPYHLTKWTGAIWLACLLVVLLRIGLVRGRKRWLQRNWIVLATGLAFPVLLAVSYWPQRGGDANYFLVPVACLCIAGLTCVKRWRVLDAAVIACGVAGFGAYLVTAAWIPGTEPFSTNLARSPFDSEQQFRSYLARDDLTYVANYLDSCNPHTRAIGFLPNDGPAFALPIRYESIQELAWNNPSSFTSVAAFQRLIRATGTQLVIVPSSDSLLQASQSKFLYPFVEKTMQTLADSGEARELAARGNYRIFGILKSALPRGCPIH